jgi:hypothetical protein
LYSSTRRREEGGVGESQRGPSSRLNLRLDSRLNLRLDTRSQQPRRNLVVREKESEREREREKEEEGG